MAALALALYSWQPYNAKCMDNSQPSSSNEQWDICITNKNSALDPSEIGTTTFEFNDWYFRPLGHMPPNRKNRGHRDILHAV